MKTAARIALLLVAGLLVLPTTTRLHAQAADVANIVNRLRAPGGACKASVPPLVARAELDDAALRLSRGAPVDAAIKAAGYRMTGAQFISVTGTGSRAALQTLLAGRFCAQIGDPALSEIGVHEVAGKFWIVLAAPFAPRLDLTRQQVADRMLALVNQARAEPRRCGDKPFGSAGPLVWDETLEKAAARHANDMAGNDYFSHGGRDGSTPAQRVARAGYRFRATGENIAAGQLSPEAAMAGWLQSPGHCANLMNGVYTELGVAFAINPKSALGIYWAQEFGTPR
jgi:uncharacterized protein YkwD